MSSMLDLLVYHNGAVVPARQALDDLQRHGTPPWGIDLYLASLLPAEFRQLVGSEGPNQHHKQWKWMYADGTADYKPGPPPKEGDDSSDAEATPSKKGTLATIHDAFKGISSTLLAGPGGRGIGDYIGAMTRMDPTGPGLVETLATTAKSAIHAATWLAEPAARAFAAASNFPANLLRGALLSFSQKEPLKNLISMKDHTSEVTKKWGPTVSNLIAASGHLMAATVGAAAVAVSITHSIGIDSGLQGADLARMVAGVSAFGILAQHTSPGRWLMRAPGLGAAWLASKMGYIKEQPPAQMASFAAASPFTKDRIPDLKQSITIAQFKKEAGKFWVNVTTSGLLNLLKDPQHNQAIQAMAAVVRQDPAGIEAAIRKEAGSDRASFSYFNNSLVPTIAVRAELAARGFTGFALDRAVEATLAF